MNHCRDCNSDYWTPGTCNCFAVGGKRHFAPLPIAPAVPWYPVYPIYPWYQPLSPTVQPWYTTDTVTITAPPTATAHVSTFAGTHVQ